jgi:Domain of unknown function (DUF4276)
MASQINGAVVKKIAFFVEGQTESIFIKELLFKYLDYQDVNITRLVAHGSDFLEVEAVGSPPENTKYEILIMDCQGDKRVLTAIQEREKQLRKVGYSFIIGVRDLFNPDVNVSFDELSAELNEYLSSCVLPVKVFIAVMEIEAWFLCDANLFVTLDASLDANTVKAACGIDLAVADVESISHPAKLINDVMSHVGKRYRKREKDAYSIVTSLDMVELLLNGRSRSKSLASFAEHIEEMFA